MFTETSVALIVISTVIVLAVYARLLRSFLWKETVQIISADTPRHSHGIELGGYFFGALLIIASVIEGVSVRDARISSMIDRGELSYTDFILNMLVFGFIGISLFGFINRLFLNNFLKIQVSTALVANNIAVALSAACVYISSAMIIAASIAGDTESSTLLALPIFIALGLVTLWVFSMLFRGLTCYDDRRELSADNLAAALSYGGLLIALGMLIAHAVEGDFVDWWTSLQLYAHALLVIVLLYPVRQLIVQTILLGYRFRWRGGQLDDEIEHHHNIGAGAIEAAAYIASAVIALAVGF